MFIIETGTAETYRQTAATMNLFPITEKLSDFSSRNVVATQNPKPMDLFPQPPGFVASLPKEEDEIATDSRWAQLLLSHALLYIYSMLSKVSKRILIFFINDS